MGHAWHKTYIAMVPKQGNDSPLGLWIYKAEVRESYKVLVLVVATCRWVSFQHYAAHGDQGKKQAGHEKCGASINNVKPNIKRQPQRTAFEHW